MKTGQIVKSFFTGCLDVEHSDRGSLPLRFTKAQLNVYREAGARADWTSDTEYLNRARCCSGIALDLTTDSGFVKIWYELGYALRDHAWFDIYINGAFTGRRGSDRIKDDTGQLNISLKEASRDDDGCVRLTVLLPYGCEVYIREIQIDHRASLRPTPRGDCSRILFLGDSITQGMDALYPSHTYPVLLSAMLEAEMLNQGVAGYYFDASSLDGGMPYRPDMVVCAYGTNDWNLRATPDEFRERCREFFETLTRIHPGIPVLAMTPIWRIDEAMISRVGSFGWLRQTMRDMAEGFPEITVLDGDALFPIPNSIWEMEDCIPRMPVLISTP